MRQTIPWWIRIPVLFFVIFGLTEYFIDSGDQPAFIAHPAVALFLVVVLVVLLAVEFTMRGIENVMFHTLDPAAQQRYLEKKSRPWRWEWGMRVYKKLLGSRPIEEEGEIILDHNYDGIRELDNRLPPWWVYSFYITIIFSVIYMFRYHVFSGDDQQTEFEKEMAAAREAVAEYKRTAVDLVDASTVELLTEPSDLAAGEAIFSGNCAVCHKVDGGGSIGPNLTDDYWILGGGIRNIFNSISEGGRDGKGMVAWKTNLKPSEIAQVASYIVGLHGTNPPDAKAPEGELYVDPDAPVDRVEVETDSTGVEVIIETDTPNPLETESDQ